MGMTLVILTGGLDLSVGSVWAMTAVLTASLMSIDWLVGPAILVGLLAAAVIGLFNGLCVTRLNMSAFVPTLATLSIARSLALIIPDSHPDDFKRFRTPSSNGTKSCAREYSIIPRIRIRGCPVFRAGPL